MIEVKDFITIDEELLVNVFRISSPSNKEDKMQEFIKKFLIDYRIDFNTDKLGNIYNFKIPDAPLLSSHMDTVEDGKDGALMRYIRIYNDPSYGKYLKGYGVIGGDDKCGVFAVLSLLRKYPNKLNFVFSVNEEHGMTGIRAAVAGQDFSKILYGIVIDRRGAGDIICLENTYGTKVFEDEIKKIGEPFGFKPVRGSGSDAGTIKEKISCANLSAGYYNPHTKKEFVILEDLQNTLNYVETILGTINTRFAPPVAAASTAYQYNYKNCKICYKNEDRDKAEIRWITDFGMYICKDCAKKLIKMANDVQVRAFAEAMPPAKETVIHINSPKVPAIVPPADSTHWHNREGD